MIPVHLCPIVNQIKQIKTLKINKAILSLEKQQIDNKYTHFQSVSEVNQLRGKI